MPPSSGSEAIDPYVLESANGTFTVTTQIFSFPAGAWLEIANQETTTNHTLTVTYRSGQTDTIPVPFGGVVWIASSVGKIVCDGSGANVSWRYVKAPATNTGTAKGINGNVSVLIAPIAPVDNQAFSGSITNGTPDAVSQAGAVAVTVGAAVTFRLLVHGSLITAGDPLTYIRLVGATTGVIYASCAASNSGTGSVTGVIRMPTLEKIDIHTANADTVAHVFTGSWEAFLGV